ncbi:hypothetical protein V3C99_013993 [Haemonchus contortus]
MWGLLDMPIDKFQWILSPWDSLYGISKQLGRDHESCSKEF